MPAPADPLDEARQALRRGGTIVYPTDTLYGLGCLADHPDVVARLRELIDRPPDKGLSVLFHRVEEAKAWSVWTQVAEDLARSFLPGPLTLVLEASPAAPQAVLAAGGTIGVRHVDREQTQQLTRVGPLIATSANPHGRSPPETVEEARAYFGEAVDAYVDAGRLVGPSSTVVDARAGQATVIREGPISEDEITEAVSRGR